MDDAQKHIMIFKVASILGLPFEQVKWDMSLPEQIIGLVKKIEELAEELEVNLYER